MKIDIEAPCCPHSFDASMRAGCVWCGAKPRKIQLWRLLTKVLPNFASGWSYSCGCIVAAKNCKPPNRPQGWYAATAIPCPKAQK